MKDKPPTEREIRKLRDKVFGHATSDKNWAGCRENWMREDSIEWLKTTHASSTVETEQP